MMLFLPLNYATMSYICEPQIKFLAHFNFSEVFYQFEAGKFGMLCTENVNFSSSLNSQLNRETGGFNT